MSMTFTKLFSGLTESTVWVEPYPTRILWVSMLSWADQHGRVFGSLPGIARRAGINMDEAEAALVSFLSPDRHSRTPDHDGRRIEKIDGGWRLLNYGKYREMRDAESRREQNREAQRKHREKLREEALGVSNIVSKIADSADNKPGSAQAEAEAEAEAERSKPSAEADASTAPVLELVGGSTPTNPPTASNGVTPRARASEGTGAAIWTAYADAYQQRHGVGPVRNAKVNGQIAQFAKRVPVEEAPHIAAWYVRSNRALYVNARHPIDLLLRDAEAIHTDWATKSQRTETAGRLADQTGQRGDVWGKLIREAKDAKPATP